MARFLSPTEIVHGPGSLTRLPEEIARLGGRRVLLVSDRGLLAAGIVTRVSETLRAARLPFEPFVDVPSDPTFADVDRIVAAIAAARADTVVSVGSGSVMGAGRSAALAATNGGASQALTGPARPSSPPLLSICLPTTAGSGGEVSRHATLTDASGHKGGIDAPWIAPRIAILDAELLLTVPAGQAVASGVDALTHALEAYVSRRATPLTDALALSAFGVIVRDLPDAVARPSVEALDRLVLASAMANVACGNAGLGLVHGINKGLTYLIHRGAHPAVSYGDIHAILLPWVWAFNAPAAVERYAGLARLLGVPEDVGPDEATERGRDQLIDWLARLGAPRRLPWVDCRAEDIGLVVDEIVGGRMALDNPRPSGPADIEAIVRSCLAGW